MAITPDTFDVRYGDGVTDQFTFDFPYLSQNDVYVEVDGVATGFTFLSGNTLELTSVPADGAEVYIYRNTPAVTPAYEFNLGDPFLPKFIDENFTQLLYAVQEGLDFYQQLESQVIRVTDSTGLDPLPLAAERAGKFLSFDENGDPVVKVPSENTAEGLGAALSSTAPGFGASLVSMEGGPSVEAAVTQAEADIQKRVIRVLSVAELEALTPADGWQALLSGTRAGAFKFDASDLSAEVTLDTQQGVYIAPTSDATGTSGAWVRQDIRHLTPAKFGALGEPADDTAAIIGAINVTSSLKVKLWIEDRHSVTGTLPFPSYTHIVAMPWARILGNFAGPIFLDPKYEATDGHSDAQVVEHLTVSNQGGDVYHVQPRNMKISHGRISAATGYGVKISSASDQAFENQFNNVLFKGCKYPIWARGKLTDPVTSDPGYAHDASDSWVVDCIFDGYAGATPVMEYALVGGGSGWFFRNNHWYGSVADKFLSIKGLNVQISDYFERNGTDYGVELLSGNPSSYNLAGSTFWLSNGGKCIRFAQGSFHTVAIDLSGVVVNGGDSSSYVVDATYVQSGSSASNVRIDMNGVIKPKSVNYATDTLRVFGLRDPLYKEDSSGGPVTWFDGDLREENIFNKTDAFSASLQLSSLPTDYFDRRIRIYNASASQTLTITAGVTIVKPDGTTGTSYGLAAQSSCLLMYEGGNYRIVLA